MWDASRDMGERVGTMAEATLYDAETGLPTRELITDRLAMALRGAERTRQDVAVVLVALTSIEGTDGPVSDSDTRAVIKEVAERLSAAVRGIDSVGRYAPETFALVSPGDVGEDWLEVLARRLVVELSPPVILGVRPYFVTARLGGTTARPGTDDPHSVLRRTEQALAAARRPGGQLVEFRAADDPHD